MTCSSSEAALMRNFDFHRVLIFFITRNLFEEGFVVFFSEKKLNKAVFFKNSTFFISQKGLSGVSFKQTLKQSIRCFKKERN